MAIKTQGYEYFSKRINKIARRKRIPMRAMFELTYRCNFKCIHCYNTDEQKKLRLNDELKTKEVFNILEQLKELGSFFLGFTGGEIFCRKDILDILWYAKRLGFEIILLTNASLIDKNLADRLKELMPNKVDITVHAMDNKIFDKITRIPGSGNKVFGAIELLHKRNIPLGLKSCGMQDNKGEIVKLRKFARRLKAIYRFDGELTPRHDGAETPLKYCLSPQEIYSLRKACYPKIYTKYDKDGKVRKSSKPKRRNLKRLFNCGVGFTDLSISPYGELKLCVEIDYPKYKILEGSLFDGWQKIKNFVDKLKPPRGWACRACDLIKYCSWCPASGYLKNGDFSTCDPYIRTIAEFTKQIHEQEKQ